MKLPYLKIFVKSVFLISCANVLMAYAQSENNCTRTILNKTKQSLVELTTRQNIPVNKSLTLYGQDCEFMKLKDKFGKHIASTRGYKVDYRYSPYGRSVVIISGGMKMTGCNGCGGDSKKFMFCTDAATCFCVRCEEKGKLQPSFNPTQDFHSYIEN